MKRWSKPILETTWGLAAKGLGERINRMIEDSARFSELREVPG